MVKGQKGSKYTSAPEEQIDILNTLLANISDQIYLFDRQGRYLYISPKAEEILGACRSDVVGKTWRDFGISPEIMEPFDNQIKKVFATGESIRGELEYPADSQNYYEYIISPASRVHGTVETVVASARDITERKQAEKALKESERILRSFFDSPTAMQGIVEVIADDEVRHIADNEVTAGFLGLTQEAMQGKLGSELGEPREILRTWISHYRQSQSTGKPVYFEYLDDRGNREAWLSATVNYLGTTPEGTPRFSYIVNDITERKRVEMEMDRIRVLLEEGQKIAHLGSWEYIAATQETVWSDEEKRIYGLDPADPSPGYEEMLRHHIHPDDAAALDQSFREALQNGAAFENENRIVRPDGSVRFILNRAQPYFDESGKLVRYIGTTLDITERRQAEEALKESEERFRTLADNIAQLAWMADETGWTFWYNKRWYEYTGTTLDEMQGWGWQKVHHPDHVQRVVEKISYCFKTGEYWEDTFPLRGRDGQYRWFLSRAIPIRDKQGRVIRWFGTNTDITEQKRAEETISHQAHHDLLTGLANRMLFTDHLNFALTQAHRYQKQLAVMFLDLDRFKAINDTLGHTIGDELLKEVARRVKPCLRETDTVARIGGDEFTVLLPQVAHLKDVSKIADKIMAAFEQPFAIKDHTFHITTSIGISVYPEDGMDADTLIRNADIAMYHAKEMGRNSYQFYSPALNVRTLERMILENSLRKTLERGELELYYQPQFDISTGRIVCTEALIRWRHPELGLLNPMQFIPIAEEIGFIVSIDEWVLRTACEQNKAWQDAGYPSVCVTVNLSSRQFKQPSLLDMVSQILKETGLDSQWLELEVTETIAMEDIEYTIPNVRRLADLGVNFSIDDFGTGYSSLSHLKRLPIQKLKIDKSFIRDITTDPDDRIIVNAIISMAHSMNLKVVAEGVETAEQLSILHTSRCDEVQGYLGSYPLPIEEYEHFIKSNGHLKVK